ncbi:hypothetical protein B0H14DRAFT_2618454 [Mycena olivaceomarginata]|nr:hypothetical protein B0H14DRAFT_2618454 [Mycena olivaceomarginata]
MNKESSAVGVEQRHSATYSLFHQGEKESSAAITEQEQGHGATYWLLPEAEKNSSVAVAEQEQGRSATYYLLDLAETDSQKKWLAVGVDQGGDATYMLLDEAEKELSVASTQPGCKVIYLLLHEGEKELSAAVSEQGRVTTYDLLHERDEFGTYELFQKRENELRRCQRKVCNGDAVPHTACCNGERGRGREVSSAADAEGRINTTYSLLHAGVKESSAAGAEQGHNVTYFLLQEGEKESSALCTEPNKKQHSKDLPKTPQIIFTRLQVLIAGESEFDIDQEDNVDEDQEY